MPACLGIVATNARFDGTEVIEHAPTPLGIPGPSSPPIQSATRRRRLMASLLGPDPSARGRGSVGGTQVTQQQLIMSTTPTTATIRGSAGRARRRPCSRELPGGPSAPPHRDAVLVQRLRHAAGGRAGLRRRARRLRRRRLRRHRDLLVSPQGRHLLLRRRLLLGTPSVPAQRQHLQLRSPVRFPDRRVPLECP